MPFGLGIGIGLGMRGGLPAPPSAPTSPTANADSDTQITVNWTNPSGTLTSYDGRYRIGAGDWTTVTGISKPWVVTGLTANTGYGFEVRANGAGGTGDWSSEATATTDPTPGIQSATTDATGLLIILTFDQAVSWVGDGSSFLTQKNGDAGAWGTLSGVDDTGFGLQWTLTYDSMTPIVNGNVVTFSMADTEFAFNIGLTPVPAVTNFPVTNAVP